MLRRSLLSGALALSLVSLASADGFQSVPQGAYTPYTPSLAAVSPGATPPTFSNVSGRWQQTGKRVDITVSFTITANGTGATALVVGLPVLSASSVTGMLYGRETAATGKMFSGTINSGNLSATLNNFDNSYPGGTGYTLVMSGSYEAQ